MLLPSLLKSGDQVYQKVIKQLYVKSLEKTNKKGQMSS